MQYGFKVLQGDKNDAIDGKLTDAISEVRIEQELSKATRFAVRFEEDLCDGKPEVLSASQLKPGTMISVLVPKEDAGEQCLIRGPITKVKSSAVVGGPGSWLEIHGEDRRIEMEREPQNAAWTGTAVDIAATILDRHGFTPDLGKSQVAFSDDKHTLNQNTPDLAVIEDLCRKLNFEFWLSYTVGHSSSILETAHFKPSPDYGSAAGIADAAIDMLAGSANGTTLRLNVDDQRCRNISSFEIDIDVERATSALLGGVDDLNGKSDLETEDDNAQATDEGGKTLKGLGTARRTISEPRAGGTEDQADEAKATLADEGWFISATASTSVELLPGIIEPHEIVRVEGTGFAHSGNYQISKVVHVINGWGHLMDLTLRRNALPETTYG